MKRADAQGRTGSELFLPSVSHSFFGDPFKFILLPQLVWISPGLITCCLLSASKRLEQETVQVTAALFGVSFPGGFRLRCAQHGCCSEWRGSGGRTVFFNDGTDSGQIQMVGKLWSESCCHNVLPASIDFIVSLLRVDFCVAR